MVSSMKEQGGQMMMVLAPQLSLQDCKILEYVLTRFLDVEEDDMRKAQIQRLHEKFQYAVNTMEQMSWDTEKLQEESPEL
jgi:hypothetical protein